MDQQSHYVGLDVSLETTSIGVIDDAGAIIWRGKCSSDPDTLSAMDHWAFRDPRQFLRFTILRARRSRPDRRGDFLESLMAAIMVAFGLVYLRVMRTASWVLGA